jgi:hypothetical protein
LSSRRIRLRALAATLAVVVSTSTEAALSPFSDDRLTEFDFLLLGLTVKPDPPSQVVPRNTATGIRIELGFSDVNADASALLSLLPAGLEVVAELVGPGIDAPIELRAPPGDFLPIPPLVGKGVYLVRDIRIERNGQLLLRANPDSATVEVIERVLITQVTTRPLTLDEIRQKGILFGDDSFSGFNFTLAMKLDSRPVTIDFPVVFDSNDIPVPIRPSAGLDLRGPSLGNTGLVPVMLKPSIPEREMESVEFLVRDISIPGLIVIPGDVGFLNQFFSAILLVSNGAPSDSGLWVSSLRAGIVLPTGANPSQAPLVIAETDNPPPNDDLIEGAHALELDVLGVGRDGEPGTHDDQTRFDPGAQGQAEFLLEGKQEGFHEISFDIQGTLEGLPIGPVPLKGAARGGVLVRNPTFHLTFTAPATVRDQEPFSLFVGVTNVSSTTANLVTVRLDSGSISGATLVSEPSESVDTLAPNDTEVLEFRFISQQTGQVSASYLNVHGATGDLLFRLGVGERGVPLSPDTIVLPKSVEALPPAVVRAALRVLGQAWSVATAPNGTLPEGVARVSKQVVLDRATEVAEAGFRVQLQEPLDLALESLLFSWSQEADPGFEQIVRQTEAGKRLLESLGQALDPEGSIVDFQREVSLDWSGLSSHILLGVGNGSGGADLDWSLTDAGGRTLDPDGSGTLPNAVFVPLSDPAASGRSLALATRLGSSLYEWTYASTATAPTSFDFAVSLPAAGGFAERHLFEGVSLAPGERGKLTLDLLSSSSVLTLRVDRDGDGQFEDAVAETSQEILAVPPPSVLAATVIGPETLTGADPWGRVIALLFDREMREAEVLDVSNFDVEENVVRSSSLQLSRRIVFLFVESPVSDLVERTIEVAGLFDTRGQPLGSDSRVIASRLVDDGAVVGGRVLDADGTPVPNAEVLYINAIPGDAIVISQKSADAFGRYQFDYVRRSPSGPFSIRATDPETGAAQQLSTRVGFDGENIVVDLVLLGRGGVTGVVRDTGGNPIAGAQVLVTSEVDFSSFALTETDGEGRYVATGIVVGPLSVKAVSGTSSGLASGNLQRAGTFAVVDVDVNLTLGTITGRVVEAAQDVVLGGVPDIEVYYLVPAGIGRELVAATTRSDEQGFYGFTDVPVPVGSFRILAIDRVRARQASRSDVFPPGQSVLTEKDVQFLVENYGSIEVTVYDSSGTPVGAGDAVVTIAGRQIPTGALDGGVQNEPGKVQVADLTPGSYTVTARAATSARTVWTTATVLASTTSHVNLQLPGTGRVLVTVLDESGNPLTSHAVIRTVGGPCSGEQVETGPDGVAAFEDVPIGNVTVKALKGTDIAVASTFLQKSGDDRALVLRFAGFGTVTGTVQVNDEPVLGARVVLSSKRLEPSFCAFVNDPAAQQVRTGLDGAFTFRGVPLGMFTVSASEPTFYPVPVSVSDVLRPENPVSTIALELRSTTAGELSGTVFLPDGATPAGAGVRMTVSGGALPDATVSTIGDGTYSFAAIFPEGRYILTASDPATGKAAREIIYLLEGQALTKDVRLLARGDVEVTVLKGDGSPVEEAFVELKGAAYPYDVATGNITPFDGGRLVLRRISEGSFSVTANDGFGRGGRANGRVAADGELARVSVTLSVSGGVQGTFVAANGVDPIPNAAVVLRQGATGRLLGSTTTSSMPGEVGTFSFEFVPAGAVLATATDPLTGRIGEAGATIETENQDVSLTIRALGLGKISGTVTSGSVGIAAANVEIASSTGLSSSLANLKASATTGAGGEFRFDGVPVGSFTIRASLPGTSPLTGMVTGNLTADGEEIEDLEVPLEASGVIRGTVLQPNAVDAVSGASLELRPPNGVLRGQSSSNGNFRFDFVPAGDFTLTAEEAGGPDAGIVTGTLAEGDELDVDVVMNGTGTIGGTALDSSGAPLSSGRVRLTRPAPFARDETANVADGVFAFLGVPVGDYSLSLSVDGSPLRGSASGTIEFDGHADDPMIQLAPATNVVGSVRKPDGAEGTIAAANVVVTLSGANVYLSTLTASNGNFSVAGVPDGSFTLRAQDPLTGGIATAPVVVDLPEIPPFESVDVGTLVLDLEPIRVETVTPAAGATLVPPDSLVVLTFSDPFVQAQVAGRFFLRSGGANVPASATVSPDGLTLTFDPTLHLPANAVVEVFVSKDLPDTFGRKLGTDFTSSFSTGGAVVTGLVTGLSGPVSGASVILTNGAGVFEASTDSAGRYRFENVGPGAASIVASHDGLAGTRVVDIGQDTRVVETDIPLSFVATIEGRVLEHDASFAGGGLEVRILQSGIAVWLTSTASDGTYVVNDIPLGTFLVDVRNPATGDRGQRAGTLEIGGASGIDVTMTGLATLRVTVEESNQARVPGASVVVSFTRFQSSTILDGTTDANGEAVFGPLLAGEVNAQATDGATGRQVSATATAPAGLETVVNLVLETTGSIAGTVFAPGGAPSTVEGATVRVFRESGNLLKAETTSAPDGTFGFSNLPSPQSPYRIDVLLNGKLRARKRGIFIPANGTATADVELVGLGRVQGAVLPPPGETLSSLVNVTLTSLAPDVGGIHTASGATGSYVIDDVPVGAFRISARDVVQGFLGEAQGVVPSDGAEVTANLQLLDNAFDFNSAASDLRDGNDAQYRVTGAGSLTTGTRSIFAPSFEPGGLHLEVTVDNATTRFTGGNLGTQEESGRELVTPAGSFSGLAVTRKVYVPGTGYFARYLEVFENVSGGAIDFTAEIVTNLNNGTSAPALVATSSGEVDPLEPERWVVVDDATSTDPFTTSSLPATAFVLSDGSWPALVDLEPAGSQEGRLRVRFDLSLPPGGSLVLLHFVSQELNLPASRAAAERLVELPAEALEGLDAGEIAAIANFEVPADGTSDVAPLPPLDGRVNGRFLAQDGITEVGSATGVSGLTAKIQSGHILYGRVREAASSTGAFRYAGGAAGSAFPRTDFTLSSTRFFGNLTVTASGGGSFTGATAIQDAPGIELAASTEIAPFFFGNAFDRNLNSFWQPSSSDEAPRPFLEIRPPTAVAVNRVRVTPSSTAALDDVQVQLFDGSGLEVGSAFETFSSNSPAVVSVSAAAVARIVVSFSGASIRIAELEAFGTTSTDIGSAFADLVFADSASLDTTVTQGGAQVGADLLYMIGSQVIAQPQGTDGSFFAAPIPVTGTDVTVTATATAPSHNFLRVTETVPVSSGQASEVALELPAGALVSGTVTDAAGAPVVRALTLFADTGPGEGLTASGTSDANGTYEFRDVPSGTYRLRIIESGRTLFFPFTVSAPAPLDFDVRIPILRDVNVRVLFEREDLTAHPAQSAQVRVQDSRDAVFRTAVLTNASGDASIADVAEGSFTIRITQPTNPASVTDFVASIDAPGPALPLTFTIPSFGSVSGQVRFGDGTTAAGSAKVEISGTDVPFATVTAGAATGNYSFTNVRAVRSFTVVARHPAANRSHIVAQSSGQLAFQGASLPLNLTLPRTGTVVLTVEEEGGGPIAGANVFLLDSFSGDFRSEGTTDGGGSKSVDFVPEGAFTVRVEMGGAFVGEATDVIDAHGETISVTITRPSDATVEGVVTAGDGETPVENAPVTVLDEDESEVLGSAVTDGAGFYRVVGVVAPGATAIVQAHFPGNPGLSAEAPVSAASPGETLTANLELPVTVVKGRVLEFDGTTAVSDATVTIHPAGTHDVLFAEVQPDGSFALFELPEGTYEIVAEDSFGLVGRAGGDLVDFALDRDVLLPEHGTVEVLPLPSGPSVFLTNANVLGSRGASPDALGRYRFERVALGSFSVVSSGGVPAQGVGELSALETFVEVELEAPGTGTVSGQVRDSNGDPLAPNGDTFVSLEGRKRETGDSESSGYYQASPSSTDGSAFSDSQVPEGEVTVIAENFLLGQAGIATGTLSAGGALELDPRLGTAVRFRYEPQPSAAEAHEVDADGVVIGAPDTVFFGDVLFGIVRVNGKGYPFLSAGTLQGSEAVLGPVRVAGVHHTRRVLVPAGAPYARIVDAFENPNGIPMEVTLSFESYLSVPGSHTEVVGRYVAGANGDGTAVAWVYAGAGATGTPRLPDRTGLDELRMTEEWRRITIPAGGTAILVHFAVQAPDLATAISRADSLSTAPPIGDLPPVLNFEP